jgi:hypothetical protein
MLLDSNFKAPFSPAMVQVNDEGRPGGVNTILKLATAPLFSVPCTRIESGASRLTGPL